MLPKKPVAARVFLLLAAIWLNAAAVSGQASTATYGQSLLRSSPSTVDGIPVPNGWKVVAMLPAATGDMGNAAAATISAKSSSSSSVESAPNVKAAGRTAPNVKAVMRTAPNVKAVERTAPTGGPYSMEAATSSLFGTPASSSGVADQVNERQVASSTTPALASIASPQQKSGGAVFDASAATGHDVTAVQERSARPAVDDEMSEAELPADSEAGPDVKEGTGDIEDIPLSVPLVAQTGADLVAEDAPLSESTEGLGGSARIVPAVTLAKIQTVDCLTQTLENGDCGERKEHESHASRTAHRTHGQHHEVSVRRLRHRRV